jgi:phosphoglycerate kinase
MANPEYLTLDDIDVSGKTVLVRVDFNTPVDPETKRLLGDARIKLHIKTLKELSAKGAKTVILAHQGRKGDPDFIHLEEHAEILRKASCLPVKYVDDVTGDKAKKAIEELRPGEILVLDNVRFNPDETKNLSPEEHAESSLIKSLASLADIYVFDGFSVAHRSHASVVGFTAVLPSVAGRVLEKELEALDKITREVKKPFLCLLGGSKVEKASDFIEYVLAGGADLVLTGGLAANLMLLASGKDIGKPSLAALERKNLIKSTERMADILKRNPGKIKFPVDVAVKDADGRRIEIDASQLPSEFPILDVGSKTIEQYVGYIRNARTILVSGPLGVYEIEGFEKGTYEVFKAIAESRCLAIASGGHTASALKRFGLTGRFYHVSLAGGAFLEYFMGKKLPGVEALKAAAKKLRK